MVTGRLPLRTAAVIFVLLETSLGLIAVGQLAGGVRRYRQRRAGGADRESAVLNALAAVLPGPVAFLVRHELLAWSSMVLLLRRRKHGVSPGAVQVSYDAALRPLGLVLVGLSVVELVVFELVVPWQPVRLALLVLGVWTLLFVLGLVAANIVRPHVITDDELLLRFGTFAQAQIPLDGIVTANARRRNASDSKALVLGDVLIIGVSGTTNIDVDLSEPTVIRTSRGPVSVRTARFAADEPAAAVRALRERVAAGRH